MPRKIRDFSKEVLAAYIERGVFVDVRFNSIEEALEAIDRTLKIIKLETEIDRLQSQLSTLSTGSKKWFEVFEVIEALFAEVSPLRDLPYIFELTPSYQRRLAAQLGSIDA